MNVPNSPRKTGKPLLASILIIGLASAPSAVRGADYWLAPPGTPANGSTRTQNSWNQPLPWTTSDVQIIIRDNPKVPSDTNVVIHLRTAGLTNLYLMDQLTLPVGDYTARSLVLQAADPPERPVLRYALPAPGTGLFRGPGWQSTLLDLSQTLARFEARNLILDANWPAWATTNTCANSAYVLGFALRGLSVRALAGLIQNVHILNCGANGIVPLPRYYAVQRECFPLSVEVPSFNFGPNAQPVWIIEDCEISDFHSVRGGYASAILVRTPSPTNTFLPGPGTYYGNRVAEVRRCQVRGAGNDIALATANSAGISFYDNVVVGTALGMNNDTAREDAPLRNVDLTNNIFLDVNLLANIGVPSRGADASGNYLFTNITVSANTVRLRSVPWRQDYGSYEWRATAVGSYTNWLPVSDPSLPVGRLVPSYAAGLLVGAADRIWFENNRFTTWPVTQFYEPAPAQTNLAVWRPLHRPLYHPVTGQACFHGPHLYSATNLLALWSMDSDNYTLLLGLATNAVAARPPLPTGFVPAGRLGRVEPVYSAGSLVGAFELQVAQPVINGNQVEIRARYVLHRTPIPAVISESPPAVRLSVRGGPNAGQSAIGTWTGAPTNRVAVFTYTSVAGAGSDEVVVYRGEGAFNPDTATWASVEVLWGTTVRFERTADVADDRRRYPGLLRLSRSGPTTSPLNVVIEAVTTGVTRPASPAPASNYDYDIHTNHWTSTNAWYYLPPSSPGRWTLGIPAGRSEVTARIKPTAGLANQDWAEHEAAYFRVVPSGYAEGAPAPWTTRGPGREVAVALWDGPLYRLYSFFDNLSFDCSTNYLASAAPELEAVAGEGDFPGADEEALGSEFQADFGEEQEAPLDPSTAVCLWTRTGTRLTLTADEAAFVPPETRLDVEEVDLTPPELEWPEEEPAGVISSDICYLSSTGDAAYALNAAGMNQNLRIGGYAYYDNPTYPQLPQPYFYLGGAWPWPNWGPMIPFGDVWSGSVVYGVDDDGGLAGVASGRACYLPPGGGLTLLPSLTSNRPGGAQDIGSLGDYIVGYSQQFMGAYVSRPTRWTGAGSNWTALDVGDFETNQPGSAHAVNNGGTTVGRTRVTVNGAAAWRAFRTNGVLTPQYRAASELVLPPATHGVTLFNNTANGVDEVGHTVGSTDAEIYRTGSWVREIRAAVWWAGENTPTVLGTIMPEGWSWNNPPGRSEALAVSTVGTQTIMVGTGWSTPTGYLRAWVLTAEKTLGQPTTFGSMINLNDSHLVWVPSGWVTVTAEDVNAQGWIVGTATASGVTRGYVLMPQPTVIP